MENFFSAQKVDNDFLLPKFDTDKNPAPLAEEIPEPIRILNLSGRNWTFDGIRPGQGEEEGFHEVLQEIASSTFNWSNAEIPGDVYTDLWRSGALDDPHYGRNSMKAKWVMEREWWYIKRFNLPEDMHEKDLFLEFEGVDYSCDVWLNSVYLGHHEGMFSPFHFDITKIATAKQTSLGGNGLAVRLNPPPRLYRNVAGRKFAWHGDYWRSLVPMGIWKPINVVAREAVQIESARIDSKIISDEAACLDIEVDTLGIRQKSDGASTEKLTLEVNIEGANFSSEKIQATIALSLSSNSDQIETTKLTVDIPDARLWWPWDLGQPDLYKVQLRILNESGTVCDEQSHKIGIREIEMKMNPGYAEDEVQYPWTMMINGVHHFLRSASWGGPPDIFYGRNSEEKYRILIQQAREGNINNLRIFGWHPTEVKAFYDICDEMGITVWQDLIPLASVTLPEDDEFKDATYAEAVAVIKDIRNHPSLVFIEGGEESFYNYGNLEYTRDFMFGLEKAIRPYSDVHYVPASPLSYPESIVNDLGFKSKKESVHPHALHYGYASILIEEYVAAWDFAAYPEFAASSPPNPDSIAKFIPQDEIWPPGPSWGHHWADLHIFLAMNFQIFGDTCTGSLEEFVDAVQRAQGIIFQWGLEHARRCKPKTTAIAICHFITYAPDFKWGIVDYYQEKKKSFDYVARAYQPVLVSLKTPRRRWLPAEDFQGEIWVVNDTAKVESDSKCLMRIRNSAGHVLHEQSDVLSVIEGSSSALKSTLKWKVLGDLDDSFTIELELFDVAGKSISFNEYMMIIADQDKARRDCALFGEKMKNYKEEFPESDYYRYFESLSGKERFSLTGDFPAGVVGIDQ